MAALSVSVIVVNWNSRDDLVACLSSLHNQTDRDFRVIVVDNGSTDGSVESVRSRFEDVRVIETGGNLGFAEACNRGIAESQTAWVALLNNDAEVDRCWLEELRAIASRADPNVGSIQSRIMSKQQPELVDSTGVAIGRGCTFHDRARGEVWSGSQGEEEIFCASAGAVLYRRATLDAMRLESGIFDRDFEMYFEDVDLGWRCRLAGWSALLAPRSIAYHARHGSAHRRGERFIELQCRRNRIATLMKNGSASLLLRTLPRSVSDAVASSIGTARGSTHQYIHMLRHGMAQRRAVGSLARIPRHVIERRWFADS